jgi:asparagine synthase (glutamine-hydrolysing)
VQQESNWRGIPSVIWHTKRTAPAPLYLLSRLVRNSGNRVVVTGEGSDEVLGGYDIFKETKFRRFWESQPNSRMRRSCSVVIAPNAFQAILVTIRKVVFRTSEYR